MKKPSSSVSATEAKNKFGDYLSCVVRERKPLLIQRHGRPAAVLVDARQWAELVEPGKVAARDPWVVSYQKLMKKLSRRKLKPGKSPSDGLKLLRELREEI